MGDDEVRWSRSGHGRRAPQAAETTAIKNTEEAADRPVGIVEPRMK